MATPWGLFFFFNEKKKLYLFFLQSVAKSKFLPIYEAKAAEAEGAKKKVVRARAAVGGLLAKMSQALPLPWESGEVVSRRRPDNRRTMGAKGRRGNARGSARKRAPPEERETEPPKKPVNLPNTKRQPPHKRDEGGGGFHRTPRSAASAGR